MTLNLGIYSIDFSIVSERLTPWFWRGDVWLSYLKAALAPLQSRNTEFYSFVTQTWAKLSYTGQHLALEEFLNDTYDPINRLIAITENDVSFDYVDLYKDGEIDPSPISLYQDGETDPLPLALYKDGEGLGGDNFTINIPVAVTYDEDTLRSQVNFYIITGKNYNIVTF